MHRHKVNLNGILRSPKGRRIFQGLKLLKSPVQWQVLDWSTAGKLQTGGVQQDPPNSPRGTQNCEEFVGVFCLFELWQFISHQLLVNMSFIVQLTMIGWQYTIEYRLHFWNVLVRFCSCKFKWSCSAVRWGQTSQSPQASRIRWEKLVSCSLGFQNCCSHRMSNRQTSIASERFVFSSVHRSKSALRQTKSTQGLPTSPSASTLMMFGHLSFPQPECTVLQTYGIEVKSRQKGRSYSFMLFQSSRRCFKIAMYAKGMKSPRNRWERSHKVSKVSKVQSTRLISFFPPLPWRMAPFDFHAYCSVL